ncbi:helix-turn-helix transcriptional regulator [Pseudonocardia alni]|uniref:helix-turn-helix transcriptional regulator n=1 Tax=Pseudonocardia alni TaxID=33907 RepID=UPI0034113447
MGEPAPDLMTVAEVSAMTRIPRGTLLNWRSQGRGPVGFRLGRAVMYERRDVLRWLQEQREADPVGDRAS